MLSIYILEVFPTSTQISRCRFCYVILIVQVPNNLCAQLIKISRQTCKYTENAVSYTTDLPNQILVECFVEMVVFEFLFLLTRTYCCDVQKSIFIFCVTEFKKDLNETSILHLRLSKFITKYDKSQFVVVQNCFAHNIIKNNFFVSNYLVYTQYRVGT